MSIQPSVVEYVQLNTEISSLKAQIKHLKEQMKGCESEIMTYLNDNNLPGVKYGNTTVMVEQKVSRKYQKKRDRLERGAKAIEQLQHIQTAPETMLEQVLQVMKGSPQYEQKLKLYNL